MLISATCKFIGLGKYAGIFMPLHQYASIFRLSNLANVLNPSAYNGDLHVKTPTLDFDRSISPRQLQFQIQWASQKRIHSYMPLFP